MIFQFRALFLENWLLARLFKRYQSIELVKIKVAHPLDFPHRSKVKVKLAKNHDFLPLDNFSGKLVACTTF